MDKGEEVAPIPPYFFFWGVGGKAGVIIIIMNSLYAAALRSFCLEALNPTRHLLHCLMANVPSWWLGVSVPGKVWIDGSLERMRPNPTHRQAGQTFLGHFVNR